MQHAGYLIYSAQSNLDGSFAVRVILVYSSLPKRAAIVRSSIMNI